MAVGLINGKFQVQDSVTTTKQFQVDTTGTLTNDLRCFWKLGENIANDGIVIDVLGRAHLTSSAVPSEWGEGPAEAGYFHNNNTGSHLKHTKPMWMVEGADDSNNNHVSFWVSAWIRLDAVTATEYIISRYQDSTHNSGWFLKAKGDVDDTLDFIFYADNAGDAYTVNASTFGALSANTWYLVIFGHDAVANQIFIGVNGGALDTTANSNGMRSSDGVEFRIGQMHSTNNGLVGDVADVGYWAGEKPTTQQMTDLYNGGNGNTLI